MSGDIQLTHLKSSDLMIGEPAPWPVFDRYGWLLLQRGATILTERQKDVLVHAGLRELQPEELEERRVAAERAELKRLQAERSRRNPFALFNHITVRLEALFQQLEAGERGATEQSLSQLLDMLAYLVDSNPDAALGAVHLAADFPYALRHPVQMAIISELVSRRAGCPVDRRRGLLAAALTSNVGMLTFQQDLETQVEPLTPFQRRELERHPERSVALLKAAGVNDTTCLTAVAQSHEKLDGSGYPRGLAGAAISPEARVLSLADAYSAMITPRVYREAVPAQDALRDIFTRRGRQYDAALAQYFIKVLGVYPPGVYVDLSNGEVAVVVERGEDIAQPRVASVLKRGGEPYLKPVHRQCQDGTLSISGLHQRNYQAWHLDLPAIWGY